MNRRSITTLLVVLLSGMSASPTRAQSADLVGAWRGPVTFTSGAFAGLKGLEYMYVFNVGGTMTESSNYDASPPVPPAYGVWRRLGPREFEAKYLFYMTKPPAKFDDISGGGGWSPAGRGELDERITLSQDGNSFTSMIFFQTFDPSGKPTPDGGAARGSGVRVRFDDKTSK